MGRVFVGVLRSKRVRIVKELYGIRHQVEMNEAVEALLTLAERKSINGEPASIVGLLVYVVLSLINGWFRNMQKTP